MRDNEAQREATASIAAGSLGERLRRARSAQALTIEQVSTELRIEAQQLRALEDERFDSIGPPVFVKGYLRHYCQLLGLDYGELLGMYERQAGATEVTLQPSRTIKLHNERQITMWIIAALALAVVMAVLFFWWQGGGLPLLDRALGLAAAPGDAPAFHVEHRG